MRIPDRTSDRLRRIHSLTGMLPLGVFLLEHITVNSFAIAGPDRFRSVAAGLGRFPLVAVIEFFGIALPLVLLLSASVPLGSELAAGLALAGLWLWEELWIRAGQMIPLS